LTHIVDLVDVVHPTVSGTSVITSDEIWVIFDREMDEDTIENGAFFVTGRDFDTWSGPDLQIWLDSESPGEETDILESPELHGIVQGDVSFERIDLSSLTVVSSEDVLGSGHLFRTKAIFTPTNNLTPNVNYTVYISGDEDLTDSLDTGISARTVFDAVPSGSNTGTGSASFTGGFVGSEAIDLYHVIITTAGEINGSKFQWWRDREPGNVFGPLRTKKSGVLLSDGVTVSFTDGEYDLADKWHVVVKEKEVFEGNLIYPFSTGSGSIEELPTTVSTSVIGAPDSTTAVAATTFTVVATDPANRDYNEVVPDGDFPITVSFSADVDAATVTAANVSLLIEAANGDTADMPASGVWTDFSLSVDGQDVEITVPSGVIHGNNVVSVSLDEDIASEAGVSLSEDYDFWFSTEYDPYYSTVKKVRLEYGVFLANVLGDTIALAIREASVYSDEIIFGLTTSTYHTFAQKQWVTCKAAEMVLLNAIGGGNSLKSKKLGDLQVTYNVQASSDALDKALACLNKWETTLIHGGSPLQVPQILVKGEFDPDRPPVGRKWADNQMIPASNTKRRELTKRRFRADYSRAQGGSGHWPGGRYGSGRDW
jgi:hypothetical protein